MKHYNYIILLIFVFNSIIAQVTIKEAFPNLSFSQIVDIQSAKNGTNKLFIVSQPGYIYSFKNDSSTTNFNTFLDISANTLSGGEKGLLGLAFHPNFMENGYFYVDYTKSDPLRTVISRFYTDPQSLDDVDVSTEKILLEVEQPHGNHKGDK